MNLPNALTCRMGDATALVGVEMEGCVCYPDDTYQPLCAQHAQESEPMGYWKVVACYDPTEHKLCRQGD